jgi:hypothetical protein
MIGAPCFRRTFGAPSRPGECPIFHDHGAPWRTVGAPAPAHGQLQVDDYCQQPGDYKSRCAATVRRRCAVFPGKSDIRQVATVRHKFATVRLTRLE